MNRHLDEIETQLDSTVLELNMSRRILCVFVMFYLLSLLASQTFLRHFEGADSQLPPLDGSGRPGTTGSAADFLSTNMHSTKHTWFNMIYYTLTNTLPVTWWQTNSVFVCRKKRGDHCFLFSSIKFTVDDQIRSDQIILLSVGHQCARPVRVSLCVSSSVCQYCWSLVLKYKYLK